MRKLSKYVPRNHLSPERLEALRIYRRDYARKRYAVNAEYRQIMKERSRSYHSRNRSSCNAKSKSRYLSNREQALANCLAYKNHRRKSDLNFKLRDAIRHRIWSSLQSQKSNKSNSSVRLLGCSIKSFRIYLESLFETGMNWENYGYRGWHIDHIIPCALFDLSKPEHQKRCFHFSNLQPLWASENFKKNPRRNKTWS